jgi:serine/threonine-protein kinase
MKEPLIGTRLGSYHVRELLGSGGMASVYKGYDPALDREVAIKVLGTAGQPDDFVARFQREARVVARMRHPNIVQIYHFGADRDVVYMVQELLPGPTLARRIRELGRRRMAADRVHAIVAQLATALDFAHGQGVIHRDVKPSNALYNAHDQVVLTDFGIARGAGDATRTVTGPGMVMGTPGYLAPEQAISSTTLTPACDIYSLGVVLFELLTGQLPFEADSPMGVVLKHLYDDPPPPSSLRPDLPPALDKLVLRALNKEPAARHPSATALAEALRAAWPVGRTATAERASRPRPTQLGAVSKATVTPTPKPRAVGAGDTPAVRRTPTTPRPTPKPAAPTPRTTPASKAQPHATPPGRRTSIPARPAAHKPPRRGLGSLRVGLFTADVVGALILFGLRPNAFAEALRVLRRLLGY